MPASAMTTKRADAEVDVRAEERDVVRRGERARGDRAGVEHDELAGRREDGVDRHQPEDGVDAVGGDLRGEARGDARDEHGGRS